MYSLLTPHPKPCPDCGHQLLLIRKSGYFVYECENKDKGCPGLASAHPDGRPQGIPINEAGRRSRRLLHMYIDRFWYGQRHQTERRRAIYEFMSEKLGLEEFHISQLDEKQIKTALRIAQRELPLYF